MGALLDLNSSTRFLRRRKRTLGCISKTSTLSAFSMSFSSMGTSGLQSKVAAFTPDMAIKEAMLTFPTRDGPTRITSACAQSSLLSPERCCCANCTASTRLKNSVSIMVCGDTPDDPASVAGTAPPGTPTASC
eukprot:CAMPEP_0172926102 /NCGR_PEP_ID=MMETSP1075-20121228/214981_1 /TAXON_ID=2916 /ORGANISM="Ceratium fusus, Strain PA161109" /LENGTH=132 /DNA_ID=CAMNT_0013787101 /DNA_START=148 /DNA_END=546 /DNA_ORIENTATION=-